MTQFNDVYPQKNNEIIIKGECYLQIRCHWLQDNRTSFDNQTLKKVGEWRNEENANMVLAKLRTFDDQVRKVK